MAVHCGLSRRSVSQTPERFAAPDPSWPGAGALDDAALEGTLYRRSRGPAGPSVGWAAVEQALSGRGVTLRLLWEEWRERHPDGTSYLTWCRRFRAWCPRRDVPMRQNGSPGEKLFVDYADMTAPVLINGTECAAQMFVASMRVRGRLYAEAALSRKIDDWCASHGDCPTP